MEDMNSGSVAKPPQVSKPSKHLENLERQRQLKNRLKAVYGTSRGIPLGYELRTNTALFGQASISGDSPLRGFGEQQFADSTVFEDSSKFAPPAGEEFSQASLLDASGMWTETSQTVFPNRQQISKFTTEDPRSRVELLLKSSTEIQVPAVRVPKIRTHLDVSQSLLSYGHEAVADSLLQGTDFCYLETEEYDHYRFGVKSIIPSTIKENEYSTLSVHGLLRARGDESELVSYKFLEREKNLYNKLNNFKVFRTFRIWKTFKLWKEAIRGGLYARRKRSLEEVIIYANPLARDLIFKSRHLLERIRSFPIFLKDFTRVPALSEYLSLQEDQIRKYVEMKANVLQSIVDLLCSTCEKFVFESASSAPPSITSAKYKSIKVNATATGPQLQKIAHPARRIIEVGMSSLSQVDTIGTLDLVSVDSKSPRPRPPALGPPSIVSLAPSVTQSQQQEQPFDGGVSYTMRAAIRVNCRKLVSLFRFVDLLIRDIIYEGLQRSVQDFYEHLKIISSHNNRIVDFGLSGTVREEVAEQPVWVRSKITIEKQINPLLSINVVMIRANNMSRSTDSAEGDTLSTTLEAFERIDLHPKKEYCLAQVQRILRDVCVNALYSEGLFYQVRCMKLFEPIRHELSINPLEDRVFIDFKQNNVQEFLRLCMQLLSNDFDYAEEQIEALEFIRFQSNTCESAGASLYANRLQDISADDIQQQLTLWDDQYLTLNHMHNFVAMGLVKVDLEQLKEAGLEVLRRVQNIYLAIIPELYVSNGDEFYRDVSSYIDHIVKEYNSLEEFVRAVEAYNVAATKVDEVTKRFRYINSLRSMIEVRDIRISDAILRQNVTIGSLFQRFNNSLTDFETNFEVHVKMYKNEMTNRLKLLLVPIQDFKSYLKDLNESMSGELNNPNPLQIHDQLQQFRKEIDLLSAKLKQLDYYQTLLQVQVFEKGLEIEIDESLTANTILWRSWKVCADLTRDFMTVNFFDAHCDSAMKEINVMRNELISNHLLNNMVDLMKEEHNVMQPAEVRGMYRAYQGLQKNMDDLAEIIPIVEKLQSPSLKTAQINTIQGLLGHKIFEDIDLTVGELVDVVKIADFTREINAIYWEAQFLYNLEQTINATVKQAKELSFTFAIDQDNKAFQYVNNLAALKESLEGGIVMLQSCRASSHSASLLNDIETNQEILSQWKKCVEMFENFQTLYTNQRLLFTSPRTARQVAPFMKSFKVADEHWRTFQKAIKDDSKLVDFFRDRSVGISLNIALESAKAIEGGFHEILHEQCERYPKLYLMDFKLLENSYLTQDLRQVLLSCGSIVFSFPLQDAFFDPQEPYNTTALLVGFERITLSKPCSGRGNVGDWLKNIELTTHERLEKDVKSILHEDHRSIMDDLRFAKNCGQAVLLKISLKFWSSLARVFRHELQDEHDLLSRLRALSLEASDQINMVSSLLLDAVEKRILVLVSNAIMMISSHRELVYRLIEEAADVVHSVTLGEEFDPQVDMISMLFALKKYGNQADNSVLIEQGHLKIKYGMKYIGLGHKLAITPLTERCLFAINSSLQDISVPVLSGCNKSATMRILADELAVELYFIDAQGFRASNIQEQLTGLLKVFVKASSWIALKAVSCFSSEIVSTIGNMLLTLQSAQLHQLNEPMDIHQHVIGKIILMDSTQFLTASFPRVFDTSKLFRPLAVQQYPLREILMQVLSSYNFVFVNKMTIQLVALVNHLVAYDLVSEKSARTCLLRCIHECGVENEHNMINASMQMSLIAKRFIPLLMKDNKTIIDEQHLRIVCNLYLEIVYNHDSDAKEFYPQSIQKSLRSHLLECLDDKDRRHRVVMVVGSSGVGKSTVVKDALNAIQTELQERAKSRKSFENIFNIDSNVLYPHLYRTEEFSVVCDDLFKQLDGIHIDAHNYFHFDLASSNYFLDHVKTTRMQIAKRYPYHRITILCEVMELGHFDPASLSTVDVVHLGTPNFNLADCIEYHLNACTQSGGQQYRKVLRECTDMIIRPCVQHLPEDSITNQFAAVESIFNLLSSMFYYCCFPPTNGSVSANYGNQYFQEHKLITPHSVSRFDEASLRRIVVFACIWVVGACSYKYRADFEIWFRSYFKEPNFNAKDSNRLLPPSEEGRSIFSHVLFKVDGAVWVLDWITVEHMVSKYSTKRDTGSPLFDLLYVHNTLVPVNYAALSMPSPDLICLASIQAAFLHAMKCRQKPSSSIAIVGPDGSGKTALLKQLVSLAASPMYEHIPTCKRWIYYGKDSSVIQTYRLIQSASSKMQHLLIEHNLPDYGSIFIEDLAIEASNETCQEGLRAMLETSMIVNFDDVAGAPRRELLAPYCAFSATIIEGKHGKIHLKNDAIQFKRLLRHCLVYHTSSDQVREVFQTAMRPVTSIVAPEIMNDLVSLSMNFFTSLQHVILREHNHHHWASEKAFSEGEKLLLLSLANSTATKWTAFVMTQIYASLQSIPSITSNDGIRIWDRIISDVYARFIFYPRSQELFCKAFEQSTADGLYSNDSFASIVDKERSVRLSNLESLQSSVAAPAQNDPISYTRNASGFYRTGAEINPAVLTAEYVREVLWKKLTEDPQFEDDELAYLIRIHRTPLGLWTDVLRMVSVIASNNVHMLDARSTIVTHRFDKADLLLRAKFAAKFFATTNMMTCEVSVADETNSSKSLFCQVMSSLLTDGRFLRSIKAYLKLTSFSRLTFSINDSDPTQERLLKLFEESYLNDVVDVVNSPESESEEKLWVVFMNDDLVSSSFDNLSAIKTAKDALKLLNPQTCPQIFEFLASVHPLLDPREHEQVRSALIEYSRRNHLLISFACPSADVIATILNDHKQFISVIEFYPPSNEAEKFSKSIETLTEYFSHETEKKLVIDNIHAFVDWFGKRRQHILQNDQHVQLPVLSSFSVAEAINTSIHIGKDLVDHPKLLEVVIAALNRVTGSDYMLSTKTSAPKWLSACFMMQFAASTGCAFNHIEHGSADTALHLIKDLVSSEIVSASGAELSEETVASYVLLLAAALSDIRKVHGDPNPKLSFEFIKFLHLYASLPDNSGAKLWLATLIFALQVNEEVVCIDRTFMTLSLLDLLLGLGLSTSAASLENVRICSHEATWSVRLSDSKALTGNSTSFLIDTLNLDITTDLLLAYLLSNHAFKDGDSNLQELWDARGLMAMEEFEAMRHNNVSSSMRSHSTSSSSNNDRAAYNKVWKATSDKLIRILDMQTLCWTSILRSTEHRDIAKIFVAMIHQFVQVLEDMILSPHEDMHDAELHEHVGMAFMRLLILNLPTIFDSTHEKMVYTLFELVLDMFFVVRQNHSEHVTALQNRGKLLHVLRNLLKGEVLAKNGTIEGVYGLIRKEKPMKHHTELVAADGSLKEIDEEVENESEADDLAEYTLLSSNSRSVIKQSFQAISQFFSSGVKGTFYAHYHHVSPSQTGASIAVIAAIEAMIDDWMDWCGDPLASMDELPEIDDYEMHPLEEVVLIMVLKPSLLPRLLVDHIASIGFGLEPILVHEVLASRKLLQQQVNTINPHCEFAFCGANTDFLIPGVRDSAALQLNEGDSDDDKEEYETTQDDTAKRLVETAEEKENKHNEDALNEEEAHIHHHFIAADIISSPSKLKTAIANGSNHSKVEQLQLVTIPSSRYQSTTSACSTFRLDVVHSWMRDDASFLLPRSLVINHERPVLLLDKPVVESGHFPHDSTIVNMKVQLPLASQGLSDQHLASEYGVLWYLQYHIEYLLHYQQTAHSQIKHHLHLARAKWGASEREILWTMTQKVLSRTNWLLILFHTAVFMQGRLIYGHLSIERTCHNLTLAAEIVTQRWLDVLEHQREAVKEMIIIEALSKKKNNHAHHKDDDHEESSNKQQPDITADSASDMTPDRLQQVIDLAQRQYEESSMCNLILHGAYNVPEASPLSNWMAAVFSTIFAPQALKPSLAYLVLNAVSLPVYFARASALQFMDSLKRFLLESETSAGWLDLLFMSHPKLSMVTGLQPWLKGMHSALTSLPLLPHRRNVEIRRDVWYTTSSFMLHEVHHALHKVIAILPHAIQLETNKDIAKQMAAHSLLNNTTTFKGRNTMITKPNNNADNNNNVVGGLAAGKRRLGQRLLLRFQSHEYDTLWAFLLAEVLHYNESISNLRSLWECWVSLDVPGWRKYLRILFDIHLGKGMVADDLLTEILTDALFKLQGGFVPPLFLYHPTRWPQYFAQLSKCKDIHISLECWVNLLQERRELLLTWLETGTLPVQLPLYLLQNPEGLFYALRETFAFKADTTIDKVHLHITCRSLHHDRHQEQKQRLEDGRELIESLGCSINLTGGMFLNGLFSSRSETLELLPPYYASHYGNEIVLHVFAALEEEGRNDEQYHCPVQVAMGTPPLLRALVPDTCTAQTPPYKSYEDTEEDELWAEQAKTVMKVRINTTEDVADCAMQRIRIVSAPRWFL